MLFSSITFLFVFLPMVLLAHLLVPPKYRNLVLLLFSLLFYAWGEPKYILLMLLSIFINYVSGIAVGYAKSKAGKRCLLGIAVALNLGILGFFKYYNFFAESFNRAVGQAFIPVLHVLLPVGISFYTFQALSYVIDIYRGDIQIQKSLLKMALYITCFPQLIAGPIVKYHDIEQQLDDRRVSIQDMACGIKRFCYGLAKKVLISNAMAGVADKVFVLRETELTMGVAWIGIICYTLQIYYDFSGYSDMAIGLGKMFGFTFIENFNYPYIAFSIQDFWRRWHISLSTWFREYLYIPLGGNRKGLACTYLNLLIVFFMTGLWHGASWNFVVWGLFHGAFLVLERAWLGKRLANSKKWLRILNHAYTMLVVMVAWVFFRADTLGHALYYIRIMFSPRHLAWSIFSSGYYLTNSLLLTLVVAVLLCGVIQQRYPALKAASRAIDRPVSRATAVWSILLLALSMVTLISGSYNPFIYFRF